MRSPLVLFLLALIVSGRPASAQETGAVGLTMSFPAAVGIAWQATDALAIRPDFTFSNSGSDSLTTSSTAVGVGVSALFYVRKWDSLRAYVSPRFGYQRSSFTFSGSPSAPSTNTYTGSGSVGAEYQLHRRFAVFAETGLAYSRAHSADTTLAPGVPLTTSSHTWGTRAGVGAILYF
jgi:hypothetical protein